MRRLSLIILGAYVTAPLIVLTAQSADVWRLAGRTSSTLILVAPVMALLVVAYETWWNRGNAIVWPVTVLAITGSVFLLAIAAGTFLELLGFAQLRG